MIYLAAPDLSVPVDCPYLKEKKFRQEYFFAVHLSEEEMDYYLQTGWRRFGAYFFRPVCDDCALCIPLRIPVNDFSLSKSQRRIIRQNQSITWKVTPLFFHEEIWAIYDEHSRQRFRQFNAKEDFWESFFIPAVHAFQSMFFLDNRLFGVGFLDTSTHGVSSIYFVYRMDSLCWSPGILSILREIEWSKEIGKKYYYLGYYIPGCRTMEYKTHFHPCEAYDWKTEKWCLL